MNVLLSTIGRRGYIASYFKASLGGTGLVVGTSDRHSIDRELTPGFDYCDRCFVVPEISSSNYVDALLEVCRDNQIGLMTSLYDFDSFVLSQHNQRFKDEGVCSFISSEEVNRICFDKVNTFHFLSERGFNTPATFSKVEDFLTSETNFPVIVKPRRGFGSANIFMAYTEEQVRVFFAYAKDMIIQEYIPGNEYGYDIFNDLDGRVLSVVCKQKIKMRSGETDQAVTVTNKAFIDEGVALAEALGHIGPLDVDFMVKDGRPCILELNPRFGGGYPLTYAAGVDFTKMMLSLAKGEKLLPQIGNYQAGLVMYKQIATVFCGTD